MQVRMSMTGARVVIALAALSLGCGPDTTAPGPNTTAGLRAASATTLAGTVAQSVEPAPTVILRDHSGHPMGGVFIAFAVTSGYGTISADSVMTDDSGMASVEWTLGPIATRPGSSFRNVLSAFDPSTGSQATVTFTATAEAGPPAKVEKLLPPSNTVVGASHVVIRLRVSDAHDNLLTGVPAQFVITDGDGSLSTAAGTTDSLGVVGTQWAVGASGHNALDATISGMGTTTYAVAALDPAPFVWYDLAAPSSIGCPQGSVVASAIGLSADGQFVTETDSRDGSRLTTVGSYTVADSSVVLTYDGEKESGIFASGRLTLQRDGGDCYDFGSAPWIYFKRAAGSSPPWNY